MKSMIKFILATVVLVGLSTIGVFAATKTARHFSVLDYFDRSILVNSKISEIAETINTKSKSADPNNDDYHSCITYSYQFNHKGSLINETLDRAGTDYGFVYDEKERLYDWTQTNKLTGKILSFREVLKETPEKFEKELAERELDVTNLVASQIPYTDKAIRTIADSCFSIEAEYEVIHDETSGTLPISARAIKIRDVGRFLRNGFKSPEILYISYEYKYFE